MTALPLPGVPAPGLLAATSGKPAGVLDLELAGPLPDVPPTPGRSTVPVLVRLHGAPVGQVVLPGGPVGTPAALLAERIWSAPTAIREHLTADGIAVPEELGVDGLATAPAPACHRRRIVGGLPSMSVVIATRDRTDSLLRCLRSIADQDYTGEVEIVVVDNAPSSDATAVAVAGLDGRIGGTAVRYLREPVPGLALAHNCGLAVATGDWVAITDDDVVADRRWLASIAAASRRGPGIACVTGLILAAELETRAQELLEQYGGFGRGFLPRLFDTGPHRPDDPMFPLTTGRIGSGANMAYDRRLLIERGGFDAAIGAGTPARGGDDLAGLLDVLRAGHTIAYEPSAIVWHWHRREYSGLLRQARHYGIGLGAYLTRAAVRDPRLLVTMVRGAVPAVRHLVDRGSEKNLRKADDFPRELERAERLGVLLGPYWYARSRWADARRSRR